MTLRVILSSLFLFVVQYTQAIQATVAHTLFFQKSREDSSLYEANILLAWRAQNNSIHFKQNESGKYVGKLACVIRWSNDTGIYKEDIFTINTPPKETFSETRALLVSDQYDYALPPGAYDLEMVLFEPDHKEELYHYQDAVNVPALHADTPFLSGLQLLDTFFSSSVNTPYTRNGTIYLPITSSYLDENRKAFFYHYETYEAARVADDLWPLSVSNYISWKPYGSPVPGFEHTDTLVRKKGSQHFQPSFPIDGLTSGNYYLNIVLADKNKQVWDKKSVFFQRYNANPAAVVKKEQQEEQKQQVTPEADSSSTHVLDLTPTFVGKFTAGQVRAVLKMLLLVATPGEALNIKGFLHKPDELYSKYFIYNFWEKRDKLHPDKAWKAYAEKIKEVNRLFSSGSVPGYESDRGRVYIQYGKPNDRIIVNNEAGSLPYEVWQYYNTEKQGTEGVFLFYKPGRAMAGYELLHSTFAGERRNGSWRTLLYNNSITGSGSLNANSQAEQYIGNR